MTTKDKDLLLKDLCARLPYVVFMGNKEWNRRPCQLTCDEIQYAMMTDDWDDVPYLRPMSSMTEEEKKDLLVTIVGNKGAKYFQVLPNGDIDNTDDEVQSADNFDMHWIHFGKDTVTLYLDWLNAHHLDYHGLIEKGLAIEVTENNNPYKEA